MSQADQKSKGTRNNPEASEVGNAQDSSRNNPAENETPPVENAALQPAVIQTENGFRIDLGTANPNFRVSNTFVIPNETAWVHVIRLSDVMEGWYRKDLLVVHPDDRTVQLVPLMNGYSTDTYTTDSVARVYGFTDEEHLVYIAVYGDEQRETTYNIEKMNIRTGEKEVLFENEPAHLPPDWYIEQQAPDDKLVLISSIEGRATIYDLQNKQMHVLEETFPSDWPLSSVNIAPDAERFWYNDQLYDASGHVLYDAASSSPYYLHKVWSPDSRFTALHVTDDISQQRSDNITAARGIVFFDQNGNTLLEIEAEQGRFVEHFGWLIESQTAILEEYTITGQHDDSRKSDIVYKAVDLEKGTVFLLSPVELESLSKARQVATAAGEAFFMNLGSDTFWKPEERTRYLGENEDGHLLWSNDEGTVFQLDIENKKATVAAETDHHIDRMYGQWLIDSSRLEYISLKQ